MLDGDGNPVRGLDRSDFDLEVDGKPAPIDTLDVSCPGDPGATSSEDSAIPRAGNAGRDPPRRIALVFDLLHLENGERDGSLQRTEVLETARRIVGTRLGAGDRIMIAVLDGGLRIEMGFTDDRDALEEALDRLESGILSAVPSAFHPTERGFTEGILALLDVLALEPGTKGMVLFSDPPPDHLFLDSEFVEIAAACAASRTALYPVHAAGLNTPRDRCEAVRNGLPRALARLAAEGGGRITRNTNDLADGFARARNDLSCRYVLGTYDRNPEESRPRVVAVAARAPGLRVLHASRFGFRSASAKRQSLIEAAFLAPGRFQHGKLRAVAFPLSPRDDRRWRTLLAVALPVEVVAEGLEAEFDLGGTVSSAGSVVHAFRRRVRLQRLGVDPSRRVFTFVESVALPAGRYRLTVVLAGLRAEPLSVETDVEVPRVPRNRVFLTGPVLGRPAGNDLLVVSGSDDRPRPSGDTEPADRVGSPESFTPLTEARVDRTAPLIAHIQACRSGAISPTPGTRIHRSLGTDDGVSVGTLPDVPFELPGGVGVICQTLEDLLPLPALVPGSYVFGACIEPTPRDGPECRETRFVVEPAGSSAPDDLAGSGSRLPDGLY